MMKLKRFTGILLALVLTFSLVACSTEQPGQKAEQPAETAETTEAPATEEKSDEDNSGKPMKVGMTVQDLSNQIWAGAASELEKLVVADGGEFSYLDCQSNVTTQVSQIENFVSSGVDVMVIQPAEANAVEAPLAAAREQGVKIYCWDEDIENADLCWLIDNYELGKIIGEEAAKWINEKYDGECEVAVLDYPQLEILLQRGNGIVDGIEEFAPNAKIVARDGAINPTEGMDKTETFLQAHPDIRVVAAIGGGAAVGANEAIKGAGVNIDDFGVFAADATPEELTAMKNGEAVRMSVLITGGPKEIADEIYGWLKKMHAGEEVEPKVYRELIPVTTENLDEHID